jgi:transposase
VSRRSRGVGSVWLLVVDEERLRRHDLTDEQWVLLEPLMPAHPRQGHRWHDHRLIMDGVFHRVRTGTPWRDLPERFGPWQTVYNRHRRWSAGGTWERILSALQAGCDVAEGRAWTVAVDSTIVRAHQHAAGARHAPPKDVDAERLAQTPLGAATGDTNTGGRFE